MATKTIDEHPTISDTLQIDIQTTDVYENPIDPYRVDEVIIYFIERSFSAGVFNTYTETVGPTDSVKELTNYYTDAVPTKTYGDGNHNPAWINTEPNDGYITYMPYDDDGNSQTGVFRVIWQQDIAKGQCREGDYIICWKWTPLVASPKQSAHINFFIYGDQQATAALPSHVTPRGKWEALLNQYTPDMFRNTIAQGEVTPSVIARMNGALGKGFDLSEDKINQILDVIDANVTHEVLLPYLSNFFKHKLWSNDPALWRRQIKRAVSLNKKKGTLDGLTEALASGGFTLQKLTKYWQIVSSATWTESFVVSQGQSTFTLTKLALLPYDINNFQIFLRGNGETEYVELGLNYVSFSNVAGVTTMAWLGGILTSGTISLEAGDIVKVTYLVTPVVDQSVENYIRSLPLMDQRDETTFIYPSKNWNVHLIAEDDVLFDSIIPQRHPFAPYVIWGKVRTEFAYSENIYNMDEYNGCASGDTLVTTEKGIKQLKDITDDKLILTENGFKKFHSLKNQGEKDTLRIDTKMGRELIVTHNHKFKVLINTGEIVWKTADSLVNDDYLLGKRGTTSFYDFNKIDKDIYYLAGFAYGDGSLYKDIITWLIPENEEESLNFISQILRKHKAKFNVRKITVEEHTDHTHLACNEYMWRITTSRKQLPIIDKILPLYQVKGRWKAHIIPSIWQGGEEHICQFLKGLFDTDGSIQKGKPMLTTKWISLAREVQETLLRLGIISTVTRFKVKYKGELRTYYRTRIVGQESVRLFKEKIGFNIESKQIALEHNYSSTFVEGKQPTIYQSDRTVLPFADTILVGTLTKKRCKLSRGSAKLRTKEEQQVCNLVARVKQGYVKVLPDNRVKSVLNKLLEYGIKNQYRDLVEDYIEHGWFFDKVTSIKFGPKIEVFDPLSVEDTQSYLSNGLVSHNSVRDSNLPCDIDRSFVDKCSACQSSCITLDIEVEDISNDRLNEAEQIIKGYIPFHTQIHSISYSSAVNEFFPPPVEDIEILVHMSINDYVIIGQSDFWRLVPTLGSDAANFLRNELATSVTVASGTATGFNDDVVIFSPGVRFDNINILSSNLLEILSGSNVGTYTLDSTDLGTGVAPIVQGSPDTIPFPLDTSAFTFRLSNPLWTDANASIAQDDLFIFSDANVTFSLEPLITKEADSVNAWSIVILSGIYAGSYIIKDAYPNNTLSLEGWTGLVNVGSLSYDLVDVDSNVILSSSTGVVGVTRRGLVTTGTVNDSIDTVGVIQGDWILYSGTQYKIIELPEGNQAYILNYTDGNAASVPITVYRRLLDNTIGYVDTRGMFIITTPDYESTLSIQNGSNPPATPVEISSFKENYLVLIGSSYYTIIEWDANTIKLSGPKTTWGLVGTSVNFSLVNLIVNTPIITPEGYQFLEGIDRRGIESVTPTTTVIGMPLAEDGISETINSTESISFKIQNRKGQSIEGDITCPKA